MRPALRTLAAIPEDADEGGAGPPLQAFVGQVAPRLLPWLPLIAIPFGAHAEPTPQADRVSEAFRRDRMHDAVHALLSATLDSPALFVLEDAHLADEASLALCRRIADAPDRPWLVAASRRPYGQPAVPDTATRLTLRPLPPADAALLATAVADRALPDDALRGDRPALRRQPAGDRRAGPRGGLGRLGRRAPGQRRGRWSRPGSTASRPTTRASCGWPRCSAAASSSTCCASWSTRDGLDVDDLARWKRLSEFVVWEGMDELAFRHDVYVDTAYAGPLVPAPAGAARPRRRGARDPQGRGPAGRPRRAGAALPARRRHAEAWRAARLAGESARAAYASPEACDAFALALEAGRAAGVPAGELAEVAEALGDVGELAGRYPVASDGYREAAALRRDEPVASARLMRKRGVAAGARGPLPGRAALVRPGARRDRRSRRRPGRRPRAGGARAGLRRGALPPGPLPGVGALRRAGRGRDRGRRRRAVRWPTRCSCWTTPTPTSDGRSRASSRPGRPRSTSATATTRTSGRP